MSAAKVSVVGDARRMSTQGRCAPLCVETCVLCVQCVLFVEVLGKCKDLITSVRVQR